VGYHYLIWVTFEHDEISTELMEDLNEVIRLIRVVDTESWLKLAWRDILGDMVTRGHHKNSRVTVY
jgi:hypothetical protein